MTKPTDGKPQDKKPTYEQLYGGQPTHRASIQEIQGTTMVIVQSAGLTNGLPLSLFLAAPDLLESAKEVLEAFEENLSLTQYPEYRRIADNLRAAIEKAEPKEGSC